MSDRRQIRRRLREQRRLREALLLDLGALVYELHRQGKRAPELLQRKAAELTVVDDEVRELQRELDGGDPVAPEASEGLTEDAPDDELGEDQAEAESGEQEPEPDDELDDGLADDELEDDEPADEEPEQPPDERTTEDQPALAEHEEPRS